MTILLSIDNINGAHHSYKSRIAFMAEPPTESDLIADGICYIHYFFS